MSAGTNTFTLLRKTLFVFASCMPMAVGAQAQAQSSLPLECDNPATADEYKLCTEALKARTEFYNQQKSEIEARLAPGKAIGSAIPKSGIDPKVTTATDAGKGDYYLLSAVAINDAATQIAKQVDKAATYVVLAGFTQPNFESWALFDFRLNAISKALLDASTQSSILSAQAVQLREDLNVSVGGAHEGVPFIAAVGGVIQLASAITSYFQSEFSVGGFSENGNDELLLSATICELFRQKKADKVISPSRSVMIGDIKDELVRLQQLQDGADALGDINGKLADHSAVLARANAGEKSGERDILVEKLKAQAKTNSEYITQYQSFYSDLLKKEGDKPVLLAQALKEKALASSIDDGAALLMVDADKQVGGYYTKKNLWTTFGKMPFFVSGGAIVSFSVSDPKTGVMRNAGVIPIQTGYVNAKKVRQEVTKASERHCMIAQAEATAGE